MYHLTCPSCQDKNESPFVRSGAVVRCSACDTKYRIKSAHFEREIHTGPRTLDETDTVLRSDSVDIDPDEVAPVSIDDEGNVVGLSGLSELMRWSDDQTNVESETAAKRDRSKAKRRQDDDDDLPQAKPAKKTKAKPKSKAKAKAKTKPKAQPKPKPAAATPTTARERAIAIKRAKKQKQYIVIGGTGLLLICAGIIALLILPSSAPSTETPDEGNTPDTLAGQDNPTPNPEDKPNPGTSETDNPGTKPPDDDLIFTEGLKPSPNPDITFQAPWLFIDSVLPPSDVPTVLTPATEMTHEGWYVMNPPRGSADASGDSNVELGKLTATTTSDGQTILAGDVSNNTSRAVANAELHIMLLDSTGNVFAETYTPLALIPPNDKQAIALPIASRYWKRSRGVRAGVQVKQWADEMTPMQGVRLASTGQGPSTTLRVSVKHRGDKPMRGVTILLTAKDADEQTIASFLVNEQSLVIPQDRWLDLVIATPLLNGKTAANWSATVQPN